LKVIDYLLRFLPLAREFLPVAFQGLPLPDDVRLFGAIRG